ncbi:hypothetical protein KUT98_23055 [Pseudomonas aeruginosa]|nr:hypothetical protein [Pseudomonas aeruginosa]
MESTLSLPGELNFLNDISPLNKNRFDSKWLLDDFDRNVWTFTFEGSHKFTIDFAIKLPDGELLTSQKHEELLLTFKNWINLQTSPFVNQGIYPAGSTAYNATRRVLYLIDYLLLNAEKLSIHSGGISHLTDSDLIILLKRLASSPTVIESIYSWQSKLSDFLKAQIRTIEQSEINLYSKRAPDILSPCSHPRQLQLNDDELILARVWLMKNNFYKKIGGHSHRYNLDTRPIAKIIYRNTLVGFSYKYHIPELSLEPQDGLETEFSSAPVRAKNNKSMSAREWQRMYQALLSLEKLRDLGLNPPSNALALVSKLNLYRHLELSQTLRYRSIPVETFFYALRHAISFVLLHGKDILAGAAKAISMVKEDGISLSSIDGRERFRNDLSIPLQSLGVKYWNLAHHIHSVESSRLKGTQGTDVRNFFDRFRRSEGLWELIRVYYGAVAIIIGTLMARRQGEITDLYPSTCLSPSKRHLIFANRKSGVFERRSVLHRPSPNIVAVIVNQIRDFQSALRQAGAISSEQNLFAYPDRYANGLVTRASSVNYNRSIDYFCDYFQTARNQAGERFYIRQHQLRRGFASLFFWGNSFGSLETLRWFLGHTDAEHLYHYITESTPGSILISAKASYVTSILKDKNPEAEKISEILKLKFGITRFSVVDEFEMQQHIEDLIKEDKIHVEPEFIYTASGAQYRILVKIYEDQHE